MKLESLDHLVLTVADIYATRDFYARVLGLEVVTFWNGRKALGFGNQKTNLHQKGGEYEPKAFLPNPGSADPCFLSSTSLNGVIEHLAEAIVTILDGLVRRTAAIPSILSAHLRDPDGNLIEVSILLLFRLRCFSALVASSGFIDYHTLRRSGVKDAGRRCSETEEGD